MKPLTYKDFKKNLKTNQNELEKDEFFTKSILEYSISEIKE